MLSDKYFERGETVIHYVEGQAGGRPLVLLHGVTVRWQTFLPVLPSFSLRYHIYALDLRGHGHSRRTSSNYRIEDYADDVIHFLREIVVEPAVLLGMSLGAHIAIQVAASVPESVFAVVLEEPPFYFLYKERWEKHPFYDILCDLYEFLRAEPSAEAIRAKVAAIFPNENQVSVNANAKSWGQLDPEVLGQLVGHRTHERFRLDELLPKVLSPVLLLQGDLSQGAQLEDQDVEFALSLLPHCTHVRVQDAGHNLHHPQPATYFQLVSHFLESL